MNRSRGLFPCSLTPSLFVGIVRLLQRKCACGGAAGISGECEECSKKKRFGLQTKLKVNKPGDNYEQEADRVVDQVMSTPVNPTVSGAPPRVPRSSGQSNGQMDAAPASVHEALASPGRPLEPALRQDMEQRFGHDFSRVRVHFGAAAEQSVRDVNAHAYTVGHDMVFDAGGFAPGTHEGRRLIAHELTHVVQQAGADRIYADRGNEKSGLSGLSPHVPELVHVAQQGAGNPVGATRLQRQVRPGRKGKTEHTGVLSSPSLVSLIPVPYGWVEVRTGEEIELKSGTKIPNMIALEYTGLWSGDSK